MGELKRLSAQAPNLTDNLLGRWAENLVSDMKQEENVPRDTGRLRDSHAWQRLKQGVFRIFCNTTYAAAVHETHKTKPRWFAKVLEARALSTLKATVESIRAEFARSGEVGPPPGGTKGSTAAAAGQRTYRKEMAKRAKERAKNKGRKRGG